MIVKDQPFLLTCSVSDPGQPAVIQFRWTRNGHVIREITGAQWNVSQATLSHQANYTCTPVNEGGEGETADVEVSVYGNNNSILSVTRLIHSFTKRNVTSFLFRIAAPTFLDRLMPTSSSLVDAADDLRLSCRVECFPSCNVEWYRNDLPLRESPMYNIIQSYIPENIKVILPFSLNNRNIILSII